MARNISKARKASKKSSARRAAPVKHRDGSRKGKVHAIFLAKGKDAALAFAAKLKPALAPATPRDWVGRWARKAG